MHVSCPKTHARGCRHRRCRIGPAVSGAFPQGDGRLLSETQETAYPESFTRRNIYLHGGIIGSGRAELESSERQSPRLLTTLATYILCSSIVLVERRSTGHVGSRGRLPVQIVAPPEARLGVCPPICELYDGWPLPQAPLPTESCWRLCFSFSQPHTGFCLLAFHAYTYIGATVLPLVRLRVSYAQGVLSQGEDQLRGGEKKGKEKKRREKGIERGRRRRNEANTEPILLCM